MAQKLYPKTYYLIQNKKYLMNNKQVKKLKRPAKVLASSGNITVNEAAKRLKTTYKENKKNGNAR